MLAKKKDPILQRRYKIRWLIGLILMLIPLAACGGNNPTAAPQIEAETWVLVNLNGNDPLEGRQPTLEFKAGQVSGNTGCNHYGGNYQTSGEEIRFDDLFSTEMACLEPDGIMEQEQVYLELLRSANRFERLDDQLTIVTSSGEKLIFSYQVNILNEATPTPEAEVPTHTVVIASPTETPTFAPPAGFNEYQDTVVGISVYIPENWIVTGIIEGEYAILQSYPENKYVGGEMLATGDTKCDLSIRPVGISTGDLVQQWDSDSMTTIVSEEAFTLQTGLMGQRFVIDSMGRSTVFITEIHQRVVLLTCFGDFTQVDKIATTLKALE